MASFLFSYLKLVHAFEFSSRILSYNVLCSHGLSPDQPVSAVYPCTSQPCRSVPCTSYTSYSWAVSKLLQVSCETVDVLCQLPVSAAIQLSHFLKAREHCAVFSDLVGIYPNRYTYLWSDQDMMFSPDSRVQHYIINTPAFSPQRSCSTCSNY